jgi:hypothetical protein
MEMVRLTLLIIRKVFYVTKKEFIVGVFSVLNKILFTLENGSECMKHSIILVKNDVF